MYLYNCIITYLLCAVWYIYCKSGYMHKFLKLDMHIPPVAGFGQRREDLSRYYYICITICVSWSDYVCVLQVLLYYIGMIQDLLRLY